MRRLTQLKFASGACRPERVDMTKKLEQPPIDARRTSHRLTMDEVLQAATDWAMLIFNKGRQVPPTWFMACEIPEDPAIDPEMHGSFLTTVVTAWGNTWEKSVYTEGMRGMINDPEVGCQAYAFVSEAYVAKYRNDEKPGDPGFVMPMQKPDDERDDVLMLWAFDRNRPGEFRLVKYLIMGGNSRQRFLGPGFEESDKDAKFSGNMYNLFLPSKDTEELKT